jgi:tape measure domain-containing protein
MTSFAQLGIKITSEGINETKTALDSLVNSAKVAQSATDNLTQSNLKAEQGNKNATSSYYDMVAKLSQSKSAYESLQMALKGYTDAQILHINVLKSHNEAIQLNDQIDKKDYEDKKKYQLDYLSAYEENARRIASADKQSYDARYKYDRDFYQATLENQKKNNQEILAQERFMTTAMHNSRQVMYENLFNQQQTASQRLTQGLSSSGQLANNPSQQMIMGMSASGLNSINTASQSLTSSQTALQESARTTGSHFNELHGILAKTHDMLIMMAAYRAINIIGSLPNDILDVNVRMETLRVQLEGISGSAGAAKKVFNDLVTLDIKTPFDVEGLAQTWIRLKNYGLEPTQEVMKSLTDGVSRLGGGTDTLNRITLQLGQAWAKNKLQLQDMKPMMDAGIPVIDLLGQKYGKTASQILEMSHAGTIGREMQLGLIQAIESWAPDASKRAMDTLKGSISNITSSWMQFQDALLNDKSEKVLKNIFVGISDSLFFLRDNIALVTTAIGALSIAITTKLITSLSAYIASKIIAIEMESAHSAALLLNAARTNSASTANVALAASTTTANTATSALRSSMILLSAVNPFVLIATGITVAVGALYIYRDTLLTVGKSTATVSNVIEATWITAKHAAIDYIDYLSSKYPELSSATQSISSFISDVFSNAWRMVKDGAQLAVDGIIGLFNGIGSAIGTGAAALVDVFIQKLTKLGDLVAGLGDGITRAFEDKDFSFSKFNEVLNKETKTFSSIGTDMGNSFMKGFMDSQGSSNKLGAFTNGFVTNIEETANTLHSLDAMSKSSNDAIKTTTTNTIEALEESDKERKKHIDSEKAILSDRLDAIDSAMKQEQNITKNNLSKLDELHNTSQISERQYLESTNAQYEQSFLTQKKYIEDKIALSEKEKSSLVGKGSSSTLSTDQSDILASYNKALADNTLKINENRLAFELSVKGKSGSIDIDKSEIESIQKQVASTNNLTDAGKRGLEIDKQVRTFREQIDNIDSQIADRKNKYSADSYKLNIQESYAIENEKIKYLELTGQITAAIQAKRDLAVEQVGIKVPYAPTQLQSDKIKTIDATAIKEATDHADKYQSRLEAIDTATKQMGITSTEAFDIVNKGFGGLINAFSGLGKSMDTANKALADHAKQTREDAKNFKGQEAADLAKKNAATFVQLEEQKTLAAVTGARQIAGAATQLFAEQSKGRQAMHNIEIALGAVEMALSLKKMALNIAEGASKFFSQSGWFGFAGIAAMMAVMVGLGYSGGGGGGSSSKNAIPLSTDTGTVLGDSSAKSNSVENVYTLLKDIQSQNYPVLKSIDQGISDLHSGITDVITRLFQAGGLSTVNVGAGGFKPNYGMIGSSTYAALNFANFGMGLDPVSKFLFNGIFGGKQTNTVTAQGLSTNPTSISDVMAGQNLNAQQFAQIETKTDGGWFGKDKFSTSTQYSALDSATQKALNGVFSSMGTTMLGLADNLGLGLSDRVKNYIIPALTVDLKGLDGEAAAKKLNGVISAALDTMSTAVFGDILGQYQQLGEGMLETAVRIVSEVAVVKDSLDKSGLSIAGDAIAISDALVQAAGGLKEFQKAFDDYYQKFYTDAERNVFSQKLLNTQLSDLNILLPSTREGYRKLVESLNINNSADAQRYSLLIKLSGAADSYYKILEDQSNQLSQLAQQQRSLDIQYMELTGNAIGALTEKRKDELAAMDVSLRFSQQSVWVMAAANKAVDDAMNVLKKSVSDQKALNNTAHQAAIAANNVQKQSANDLLSALKTVAANLKSALQSTVIESDDFVRQRRIAAQTVLTSALSSASSGGSLANYAGLDKALVDISKPSEQLYTSFIDFARDQGRTGNVISRLSDYTSSQISVAEQTLIAIEANNKLLTDGFNAENTRLDALVNNGQSQVDAINGTTAVVMTVADAVANLSAVMNAKMTIERAVAVAKNAEGREFDAKSVYDAANQQAAKSQQAVNDAIATANKAAQAANAAQLTAQKGYGAAPTTYVNGQSGNPIWEQILSGFNAAHQARFGTPMNRAWGSDSDAQNQYQQLVAQYNVNSAAAVQAALANAAGLASIADASAALIPGYQATALADSQSAAQAAAAYATASAYATAAKAAVPGINSFAIGTNYVESDRWAMVHQGERIMPAADNEQLFNIMSNTNNNKSSDAEIRLLRQEMAKLQVSNAEIARTNKKMADILVNVTMDGQAVLTTPA